MNSFPQNQNSVTKLLILSTLVFLVSCHNSKPTSPEAKLAFESVIPRPVSTIATGKTFFITKQTSISIAPNSEELGSVGKYLADKLKPATGFDISVSEATATPPAGSIYLTTTGGNAQLGEEGYELTITEDLVKIVANKPAGLFMGVQTLRQILPPKVEQSVPQEGPWEIATGTIVDYPQYSWRGSMLDVARHFFSVEDVKRYIDLMAEYKMNIFHLSLTNDQGWRIEIKSWPNLALIGGTTQVGGGKAGYYTQEQYKDIVAYAQRQFITVVPEIDMPGHINSALASYGELNAGIPINPEPGPPKPKMGVPYTGTEVGFSTLRLEKPATFKFVDDVLRELAAITPGPWLHIGGDEAAVTKKDDYKVFIDKFQQIVKSHGKKMIGWEDISRANIESSTLAQHWHSSDLAQMAVEKGAKLIMSPATKVYLDMQYDSTSRIGLHWAAYIEADSAYLWDPATQIPGIGKEHIIGVEAPLWGETIRNMDDAEYLMFPRLPAAAEIGWTPSADRKWDDFKVRLGNQSKRWKIQGIDFYRSAKVPWVD